MSDEIRSPTEGASISATVRLDSLTSLRGFAALLVVLYHCESVKIYNLRPWTQVIAHGYLAVDFFFVLSGFVIAYVYAREFDYHLGQYRRYLALRLGRIYPVHLVGLCLAALAIIAFQLVNSKAQLNTPASFLSNLLLVQAWGLHDQFSWNLPAWSVSAEWFAYLIFPALLALSAPVARRPWLAGGLAGLAIIAWGALANALVAPGFALGPLRLATHAEPGAPFDATFDFGLARVTLEFMAGVLLFRIHAQLRGAANRWATPASLWFAGIVLISLHFEWPDAWAAARDTIAVNCLAAIILCLSLQNRRTILHQRAFVCLGEISYSIYIVHGVFLYLYVGALARHWFDRPTGLLDGALVTALFLIGVLVAGVALNRLVEEPARRWVKRRLARPAGKLARESGDTALNAARG
jgi:peptidoglycan/LPS O-acetylase OafA/YrhL